MADGVYERRGPREAELKRLQRIIEESRLRRSAASGGAKAVNAVVSLGSNVEPRREYLSRSLELLAALPETKLVKASSVVETEPVDVPAEFAGMKFLNQVALFETSLDVREFSRRMHAIEDELGRVRTVRNGPRTIDIDLVDFGAMRMNEPELTLPHPRAYGRRFVTGPLAEMGISLDLRPWT